MGHGMQNVTVKNLLKNCFKKWDHDIIDDIFNEADACGIMKILLSIREEKDL